MSHGNHRLRALALCLGLLLPAGHTGTPRNTGPWDLASLRKKPAVTWGLRSGLAQEVYYKGVPYLGKSTRVFAYLGRPSTGQPPFPAMLLVHGGGGKAFQKWAEHWAERGYVALAMDTAGSGPQGRLPDGGPDQKDTTKFRDFGEGEVRDMWTYHAVAAVIRGHSLLESLPEVDRTRIGITGISWGGYLTCIVAGIDNRLRVAVPVYGCGFLNENSHWKSRSLADMNPEARERWVRYFDPLNYLSGVICPIFFLNGATDFAYPLDSYKKSYRLVPEQLRHVSIVEGLKHGHIWTFREVDCFVDSVLQGGKALPHLQTIKIDAGIASVVVTSDAKVTSAELWYTKDLGEWQKRSWESIPAELNDTTVSAQLPRHRPLACYITVTDERGLRVSTEHEELKATP